MSANTQTITAKYNGFWYCWVVTAEDCSPDGSPLEIDTNGTCVYKGKTEREAMSKAFQAFNGDIEYQNIRAENGKAYLVKDGTPVFITELRQNRTVSKKEQVAKLEKRVAELERKIGVLSSIILDNKNISLDVAKALREISETLDIAVVSVASHSLNLTPEQKKKALQEFFSENKS